MTNQAETVIDHFGHIAVPGDVWSEPVNEYWALLCLWNGLEFLHRQAQQCEQIVNGRLNPAYRFSLANNAPEFEGLPRALLTCSFHWYAVTACNYARTVGAIAYRQDNNRPIPPQYVNSVLPELVAFRDKIAAHFAWSTKNSRDNDAEQMLSVMPPLTFEGDAFYVGGMTLFVRHGGTASTSEQITPWSITKVHAELRKRYWPNGPSGQS